MKRLDTRKIALCGLFASFTAIYAQISLPIGPIPINLASVAVFLSAGVLGAKYGAISQIIYVLMGAIGLPVFSGFMGGVGQIAGPTGGYIVGYVLVAFVIGSILRRGGKSWKLMFIAMYIGWIVLYGLGTAWYCFVTETGLVAALTVCVIPFLLGDFAKTLLSAIAIKRLNGPVSTLINR